MDSTILIAGNPSKLVSDLVHESLSKQYKILSTLDPGTEVPPIPAGLEEGLHYVEWNRRSPISARFVVLQAQNLQLDIDHALITFHPKTSGASLQDLSSAYIEEKLDFDCKGYLFLIKELMAYFSKRGKGSVSLLYHNPGPDVLPPMEAILEGAFLKLGESLFKFYEQESIVLRGIHSSFDQNRQVAEYVLQVLEENHPRNRNKWIKYTGKTGLFSFGR